MKAPRAPRRRRAIVKPCRSESALEDELAAQIAFCTDMPQPDRTAYEDGQVRWAKGLVQRWWRVLFTKDKKTSKGRKPETWRADFHWSGSVLPRDRRGLIVEVQGGTWSNRGHASGHGYQKDCERQRVAVLSDYDILYFTAKDIKVGAALATLEAYFHCGRFARKNPE